MIKFSCRVDSWVWFILPSIVIYWDDRYKVRIVGFNWLNVHASLRWKGRDYE